VQETQATTAATEAPKKEGGFPPFDQTTFPSQFFWLAVTFGLLFVVLWRVAGPRINGVITARRGVINGDIQAAQKARGDAESAGAAYQTALAGARARANAFAEENRQALNGEIAKEKAKAEADAQAAMSAADARINATREAARGAVTKAAEDAAIAIVARLTGDTVPAEDAANAVKG
jgi:F-type H+-transporting ATPase subunit b